MSITYPNSSTSNAARAQYSFDASVGSVYPIIISGSTTSEEVATLFAPPQELYKTNGTYNVFAVGKIVGSNITGSLEIDLGMMGGKYNAFFTGSSNAVLAVKFSGSYGIFDVNFEQVSSNGTSLPVYFSGSASNYTASIYGIYFSPIT